MKSLIASLAALTVAYSVLIKHPELPGSPLPAPVENEDYYDNGTPLAAKTELGRLLFFDKILSGNQNISCATCHHPQHGSSDGVALAFGEGPQGIGPDRSSSDVMELAVHERVPRNSPALFNLGAKEFGRLYHDGRVEVDPDGFYEGGFITPAKWKLPTGLDNVLAAQAMFPVTSPAEMAGQKGENPIADARSLNNAAGPGGVWELLAKRLQANPEYVRHFKLAYPETVENADDITMVLAANAIAAFETNAFRADNSPFDQFLREERRLSPSAERGMRLFYGKANCQSCHSGKFQTDHSFHAIAVPQIGPGKSDGRDPGYWRATGLKAFPEDFGRGRVTMREEDRYRFRTPSLRNVTLTGPWGHDGAFPSLEAVVRHHLDPVRSLEDYKVAEDALLPLENILETTATGPRLQDRWIRGSRLTDFLRRDNWVQDNPTLRDRIADANELTPINLSDAELGDLRAFLESLTDSSSVDLMSLIPQRVPSGLPID